MAVAAPVALFSVAASSEALSSWHITRRYPPPGQLVDVGGYRLHFLCLGSGSPTVVLEAGLGDPWDVWSMIQTPLSRTTRVCAYDRAGDGYSEEGPAPRDGATMVAELHALLRNAGVHPPVILAGHSLGGLTVRLYAYTHPSEVAALVLVDPAKEEQFALAAGHAYEYYLASVRRQALTARFGWSRLRGNSIADTSTATAAQRTPLFALGLGSRWQRTAYHEMLSMRDSTAPQVRRAERPLSIPVWVIDGRYMPEQPAATETRDDVAVNVATWHRLNAALAAKFPNGRLVQALRSTHYVPRDQPDVVLTALTEAIASVRRAPD